MAMKATKCQCGAITVSDDGFDNSMSEAIFNAEYPDLVLEEMVFCNCNHCVNHWGIDLCECGSGEPVGQCEEGFTPCLAGTAAQIRGERKKSFGWAS